MSSASVWRIVDFTYNMIRYATTLQGTSPFNAAISCRWSTCKSIFNVNLVLLSLRMENVKKRLFLTLNARYL
jgi:hypothetical protein